MSYSFNKRKHEIDRFKRGESAIQFKKGKGEVEDRRREQG